MDSIFGLIVSVLYIIALLVIATKLQDRPNEFSRTFVHIAVANWWLIAMLWIHNYFYALSVPLFFIVFNAINIKTNWIPAINSTKKYGNYGTVYYALSVAALTALTFVSPEMKVVGGIGILSMGYGDGFAALIGQRYGKHTFTVFKGSKSIEGSLAMFVSTLVVLALFTWVFAGSVPVFDLILIALMSALVEAISPYGLDNLFVPMLSSLLYFILIL